MHLVNHKFHNCATVTTQLKLINAGIKLTVDQSVAIRAGVSASTYNVAPIENVRAITTSGE